MRFTSSTAPAMEDRGQHCPFLNRADARCSTHFSLDRLDRAFAHCFGGYDTCPIYLELLVERRVRRLSASAAGAAGCHGTHPLVQLMLPDRHQQHAA